MKPVLKWAGGKSKIAQFILENSPKYFNDYWEPFFGGGAFAIKIYENFPTTKLFLSDINPDLISFYIDLACHDELITAIMSTKSYWDENPVNDFGETIDKKKLYYHLRDKFNSTSHITEKNALFYFLNKTGFNGLMRYNSKGKFNVSFGDRDFLPEYDVLEDFSLFLRNPRVKIDTKNFTEIDVKEEDFVYFDPPYHPLNETSNFTNYSSSGWGLKDENNLLEKCHEIDNKKAFFLMSNNDVLAIRELFGKYNIKSLEVMKTLAGNGNSRGKTKELLISNY